METKAKKNSAVIKPTQPLTFNLKRFAALLLFFILCLCASKFYSFIRPIPCLLSLRDIYQTYFMFQSNLPAPIACLLWGLFCFSILIKEVLKQPGVGGSADLGLPARIYLPAWSRRLNVKSCLIQTSCVSAVAKLHPRSGVQTSTFRPVELSSV